MNENNLKIPNHVAIILDGNGRWAKKRMMPRNYGHAQGSKVVEKICEDAYRMGIKYLTVYAFSTENWKRPKEEVDALMKLLRNYLETSISTSKKNNMRVRIIGDISGLSQDIQEKIRELEEASKMNTGLNFQVAINYGSRDEIIRAVKALSKDVLENKVAPDNINEELFSQYLDTRGIPEPDLLIRTSGEQRLSNFLLWQMAYTEFYFTDVLWPDFNKDELLKAVEYYSSRTRKFGGIIE
ncbi:undecaprenyl diphosphate synthase [Herbinix hemicellulosilytica]|mgnify:FL=1|uniref:Isoprenyl transferase n=1 Tax=Herbinix hemicellulosilytica TaxID=1564487 RepID=A0A0H5SW29_HERHM|nr:isoprenyl transferase [Herbinix hemicellulosilytica]RBP60828.1 undecaprenyl diphosphate synthase [Herbinix hemicellulosilytica]CRZ34523.1 Isoprenyl transferase [Herbinix hemicellulosilytica]